MIPTVESQGGGSEGFKIFLGVSAFLLILGGFVTLMVLAGTTTKVEKLNAFTRTQVYPDGTSMEIDAIEPQSPEQRKQMIKFADEVYVREYGGPFGSGREYMQALKGGGKIKSSEGYGFRPPPPDKSVFTEKYNEYPSFPDMKNGITYRGVNGKMCSEKEMDHYMSMSVDGCAALCSHDNQCMAYAFDFSNGGCKTFMQCASMKDAGKMTKTFVKSNVK